MTTVRYCTDNKRIKLLIVLALFLLFSYSISIDAYGQSDQPEDNKNIILIESKEIDYDDGLFYANIKIQLNLDVSEVSTYLVLPIKDTMGIDFYVEPPNDNITVLSGFFEDTDCFVVEVLPINQGGELNLTLNNVLFVIKKTSNEESFGYYELCFGKTKEIVPISQSSLIRIDEIHVKDNNLLYTIPKSEFLDRNTISFSSSDMDSIVYISKTEKDKRRLYIFLFLVVYLIPGIFALPFYSVVINIIRQRSRRTQGIIGFIEVVLLLLTGHLHATVFFPTDFYDDTSFEVVIITGTIAFVYLIGITVYAVITKKVQEETEPAES